MIHSLINSSSQPWHVLTAQGKKYYSKREFMYDIFKGFIIYSLLNMKWKCGISTFVYCIYAQKGKVWGYKVLCRLHSFTTPVSWRVFIWKLINMHSFSFLRGDYWYICDCCSSALELHDETTKGPTGPKQIIKKRTPQDNVDLLSLNKSK